MTVALVVVLGLAASPAPAAAPASLTPAPSPSAAAAGQADPCANLSSVVSRPSVTTAACAVKPYDLLIESGYTNEITSGGNGSSSVSYPQANLRVGVARNLEFDLGPPSFVRQSSAPRTSGISDASIGFAYEFGYTSKLTYGTNVVTTLPNGTAAFSANGQGLIVNLNGALALSPALGLFGTVGYDAQSQGIGTTAARYHDFAPSIGASLSLPLGFNVYVEGFGQTTSAAGSSGRYAFDTGVQKDIGSRVQLDASLYEYAANHDAPHQASAGFGASYLIGPG